MEKEICRYSARFTPRQSVKVSYIIIVHSLLLTNVKAIGM